MKYIRVTNPFAKEVTVCDKKIKSMKSENLCRYTRDDESLVKSLKKRGYIVRIVEVIEEQSKVEQIVSQEPVTEEPTTVEVEEPTTVEETVVENNEETTNVEVEEPIVEPENKGDDKVLETENKEDKKEEKQPENKQKSGKSNKEDKGSKKA